MLTWLAMRLAKSVSLNRQVSGSYMGIGYTDGLFHMNMTSSGVPL